MNGHYTDLWQAIARELPDRTAIRTADDEHWSYARLVREAGALGMTLGTRGLTAGDRVALLLHNRPEFLVTYFACLASGITPVPLNYRLRPREIAALLDDSAARLLIYPSSLAETAREAVQLADHPIELLYVRDDASGNGEGLDWPDAIDGDAALPDRAPEGGELWIYTGGTTGRPKAVRWNASDLFEMQMFMTYGFGNLPVPDTVRDAVLTAADPATPRLVSLPLAPFMHGTALTNSLNTLNLGGTVLVTSSAHFDAEAALRFANDAGATRLVVAGDAVTLPFVDAAERLGVRLPTVTTVISSGMRFSPETKRRLHELGDLQILDVLAATESGAYAVTATTGVDDLPGRPTLAPAAVVFDDQLNEIQDQPGMIGLIAKRGALPLGYHGDQVKTDATFRIIGGVRHVIPGDFARVEDDRHIELLGRGSSVINTGGEKVYPLEVEEALMTHAAVADAVAVGAPDARFGEIVTAVVELTEPGAATAEELLKHVDGLLAGYKRPRHVLFRASMDRTPTGKVDIAKLRSEVVADRERPKISDTTRKGTEST